MEYGLIGQATWNSFAKLAHSQFGEYEYILHSIAPHQLASFVRQTPYKGINVGEPYKESVVPFCDALSPEAREMACVNTILRDKNGKLTGYNTDYKAMLYMIDRSGIRLGGKKVLIYGDSGDGRAARMAAEYMGARECVLLSRRLPGGFAQLREHLDAQIVVHTAQMGQYIQTSRSLVNLELFPQCEGVIETFYSPLRSSLLLAAKERGIPATDPIFMLAAKIKYASELFTGRMVADERIRHAARKLKREISNIVLIGMPGCGKTAAGKYLAQKLGRGFLDVDTVIEQRSGVPVSRIIEREGESAFRNLEARTIANVGKQTGKVISAGSGAVLAECNYGALKQNGVIVFLERPVAKLALHGKSTPGQIQKLEQIYAQRLPRYLHFADCTVDNADQIPQSCERILEAFLTYVDDF